MVIAIITHDEYRLGTLPDLSGWALDVGAHVGSVAVALAVDHPALRVVAIEPVPENAALIRANAADNGVGDRIIVREAAAGPPGQSVAVCVYDYSDVPGVDPVHVRDARFVGGVFRTADMGARRIDVPVVSLPDLVREYGRFRFLKTDCEGGEWGFLSAGCDAVDEIVGEYHDRPWPAIAELLAATHTTTLWDDGGGIGLFRAIHMLGVP